MNDIKYIYKTKYTDFELVENSIFDKEKEYPLFKANESKHYHIDGIKLSLLNYPLPVIKLKDRKMAQKIKEAWLLGYSDYLSDIVGKFNEISEYEYKDDIYIVLKNKQFEIIEDDTKIIFENGLSIFEELGSMNIDERLVSEIYELDQNLQSTPSVDLTLDLLAENTDMNKYIPFIKKHIKDEHLEDSFFFDEYLYNIFAKKYLEALNDTAAFKDDPYGRKGIERFIDISLKGEYNDECRCISV